MSYLKTFFLITILFVFNNLKAQLHCSLVEFVPNTSINELLSFDEFSDYLGGITINGAAKIRVRVQDQAPVDPECSWSLKIIADNGAGATPVNEWEELLQYGSGAATNPQIALLEIRVRNGCATSPNDGVWRSFPLNTNGDELSIIDPVILPGLITPAGSCAPSVNGPGDYLSNYNEYNFNIDIRVVPNFTFNPGIYELNLKFHLEENSP